MNCWITLHDEMSLESDEYTINQIDVAIYKEAVIMNSLISRVFTIKISFEGSIAIHSNSESSTYIIKPVYDAINDMDYHNDPDSLKKYIIVRLEKMSFK